MATHGKSGKWSWYPESCLPLAVGSQSHPSRKDYWYLAAKDYGREIPPLFLFLGIGIINRLSVFFHPKISDQLLSFIANQKFIKLISEILVVF